MSAATLLTLHAPAHAGPGFAWVARVLLGRFLGLDASAWRLADVPSPHFRIEGPAGRIVWPDLLFASLRDGAASGALPVLPLPSWPIADAALAQAIGESHLPLLYAGDMREADDADDADDAAVRLPLDLFGAAFFMLSRYEEWTAVAPQQARDKHGRFPAAASIAQRAGVLHRPLVDEYTELLWWALARIAPGLTRAPRGARLW